MPQLHLIPLFPASHDQHEDTDTHTAMTMDFSGGIGGGEGNNISPPKRNNNRIRNHHGRPICSFPGCFKSIQAQGVCCQHGAKTSRSKCRVSRCQNSSQRGGLCRRHGSEKLQICTVESCPKWGRYCDRHTMAMSTELDGGVGDKPTTVHMPPPPPAAGSASRPASVANPVSAFTPMTGEVVVTPPSPCNNTIIFPPPSATLPPPPSFAGRSSTSTTTPTLAHLNNKNFYTNLAQVIGCVPNPLQPPPPPTATEGVPLPPPAPPTDNSNNTTGHNININTNNLTGKRIVVVDKDFYQKLAVQIAAAQERQMTIRNATTTTTTAIPQVQVQGCAPVGSGLTVISVPTPPTEVVAQQPAPPVVEMNYENYSYTNGDECNNNDSSNGMMIMPAGMMMPPAGVPPENPTAPSTSFILQPSPPSVVLPNTMTMATVGGVVPENHSATPGATSFVLQPSPSVPAAPSSFVLQPSPPSSVVLPTAIAATDHQPAKQVQTIVTKNVVAAAAAHKERVGRLVQLAIPNIFSDEINDQNLRTARILHAARMAVIRAATANNNNNAAAASASSRLSLPIVQQQQTPTNTTTTGTSPTTIMTANQWSN